MATKHKIKAEGLGCVQGKARVLSADDDAKAAALQWASEAAFGSTEVAAPKILGDIVESLVGAVYIDSNHDFDKTWQVGAQGCVPGMACNLSIMQCLLLQHSLRVPGRPFVWGRVGEGGVFWGFDRLGR